MLGLENLDWAFDITRAAWRGCAPLRGSLTAAPRLPEEPHKLEVGEQDRLRLVRSSVIKT